MIKKIRKNQTTPKKNSKGDKIKVFEGKLLKNLSPNVIIHNVMTFLWYNNVGSGIIREDVLKESGRWVCYDLFGYFKEDPTRHIWYVWRSFSCIVKDLRRIVINWKKTKNFITFMKQPKYMTGGGLFGLSNLSSGEFYNESPLNIARSIERSREIFGGIRYLHKTIEKISLRELRTLDIETSIVLNYDKMKKWLPFPKLTKLRLRNVYVDLCDYDFGGKKNVEPPKRFLENIFPKVEKLLLENYLSTNMMKKTSNILGYTNGLFSEEHRIIHKKICKQLLNLPKLRTINLGYFNQQIEGAIHDTLFRGSNFGKIQKLQLFALRERVVGNGWEQLMNIRKLSIIGCYISDCFFQQQVFLDNLEELVIFKAKKLEGRNWNISPNNKLKVLKIWGCWGICFDFFEVYEFPKLENLFIDESNYTPREFWGEMPKLVSLSNNRTEITNKIKKYSNYKNWKRENHFLL